MSAVDEPSRLLQSLRAEGATDVRLYRAPGRVNIIGEHTDYNAGLAMPVTTSVYTWIAAAPRTDGNFNVRSVNMQQGVSFNVSSNAAQDAGNWANYLLGVVKLLHASGIEMAGADVIIDSDIPIGGGLSSSAALEVGFAVAVLDLCGEEMDPEDIAALCQRAEIEYAGVNCGVMDQFAVACCKLGTAMLLDCRDLRWTPVVLPEVISFLLTDSGAKHSLNDGGYNDRAAECRQAVEILRAGNASIEALRDVTLPLLDECRSELGETLFRRTRHVVTENERVCNVRAAMQAGDVAELGQLISASHSSLRDDFEVSCKPIEKLVALADSCEGVFGSRMVGGGFGGCVLSVVATESVTAVESCLRNSFESTFGATPWLHWLQSGGAATRVNNG